MVQAAIKRDTRTRTNYRNGSEEGQGQGKQIRKRNGTSGNDGRGKR